MQDREYQFINETRYKSATVVSDLDSSVIDSQWKNSSFRVQQRLKAKHPIDDPEINKEYSQSFQINIVSLTPLNDITTVDNNTHHTNNEDYTKYKSPKMIPEGSLDLMQKRDQVKKK